MLQDINPYLNYIYHKLSKYSLIGLGLIFCALILFFFEKVYLQKKLENKRSELVEFSRMNKTFKQNASVQKLSLEADNTLNLPKKTELPNILEFIQLSAKQNNIIVDNINYKFTELPSIHSQSYEITFPVTGKYLDIRKFLSQISQNNSGVILQNVEISRENNQVTELDALLQLAIYAKN